MALIGRGALALALLLALYAVVTGVLAGRRRDLRYVESARHALYAVLAAVLVADFVFLLAIVRHDFSFVTSRTRRRATCRSATCCRRSGARRPAR